MNIDALTRILACPVCHGELQALFRGENPAGLACETCQVVYPLEEEIAIMLANRAIPRQEWDRSGGE